MSIYTLSMIVVMYHDLYIQNNTENNGYRLFLMITICYCDLGRRHTSILSRQTRLIPCLKRPQHFITLSFIIPHNVQRSCFWIAIMYNYVYLHCLAGIHSKYLNIIDVLREIMNLSAVHQHKFRLGKYNYIYYVVLSNKKLFTEMIRPFIFTFY